jgi:hypothetical protein
MFRFHLIKRLPKKPLVGLALLAVIFLAAGGGVARRADAAGSYTIQVTWSYVHWSAIDDGLGDHTAEVYGTLGAHNNATNQHVYRTLGNGGKGTCTSDWSGPVNPGDSTLNQWGLCNKRVNVGPYHYFAKTRLSPFPSANQPDGNYTLYNNIVTLQVAAGQSLTFISDLSDYDALSANDPMCHVGGTFSFTDAQLQTLHAGKPLQQPIGSSDGTCMVMIELNRI